MRVTPIQDILARHRAAIEAEALASRSRHRQRGGRRVRIGWACVHWCPWGLSRLEMRKGYLHIGPIEVYLRPRHKHSRFGGNTYIVGEKGPERFVRLSDEQKGDQ